MVKKISAELNLIDRIKKEEKMSLYGCLFYIFMIFIAGVSMFYRDSSSFFAFDISVLISLGVLIIYLTIVLRGKKINKIIVEVSIDNHYVEFTTASFKIISIYKLKPIIFKIDKNDFNITTSYFPLEKVFAVNGVVFKIINGGNEFFVLGQYFDFDFKREFKS